MGEARHSRSLIIIFIIILLLHIFTLWIAFITSFNHSDLRDLQVPPRQEDAQQKNNQLINPQTWKALHAKPSAPVIFKNTQTGTDSQTRATSAPELLPEKDPIPKPLIQEKPKTVTVDKPLITDIHGKVPILTAQKKPEQKNQTHQPLIEAPKIPERAEPQKNETQKTPPAAAKKFSFNTLAQGFAQHMHDQGADQYSMRGKEKGEATAQQLKYAQYASKICNTITNAFVTNKRKLLFTSYAQHDAIIKLIVNKDGTLKDALVAKSSTVLAIDLAIISVIKEAAQGFPPLPEFFGMEQFPLTIVFNNAMQIIEHPEQSYWSL